MQEHKDEYKEIGLRLVPQDAEVVLRTVYEKLEEVQQMVNRAKGGEFDGMPDAVRNYPGSEKHHGDVLRDITNRLILLQQDPVSRLINLVIDYHRLNEEWHDGDDADDDPDEVWGPSSETYVKAAYEAISMDDYPKAWSIIIEMNKNLAQLHQPEPLYLSDKNYWPEVVLIDTGDA